MSRWSSLGNRRAQCEGVASNLVGLRAGFARYTSRKAQVVER